MSPQQVPILALTLLTSRRRCEHRSKRPRSQDTSAVPRDPPAWRYQESEGERAERQVLENLGAWTG
jgi:hypothetical protein